MRRVMRSGLTISALGAVALVGCGGGDDTSPPQGPADVVARGNDALQFDQPKYTAKGGNVVIELVNDGVQPHTLLVEKKSGFKKLSVSGKGDTSRGTATFEPGTYTIYCDVVGHRGAGMEAQLVIN